MFIIPICFLNFNACSRDYLNIFFTLFYIFWAMAHSFCFFNSMVHNKLKIIWNHALQSNKDNIASQSIDTRIVIYTMRCTQSWYPGKNWRRKIGSLSFKSTVIPQQNANNFFWSMTRNWTIFNGTPDIISQCPCVGWKRQLELNQLLFLFWQNTRRPVNFISELFP